jgi:phosphoserine phosphatase RsbU/P
MLNRPEAGEKKKRMNSQPRLVDHKTGRPQAAETQQLFLPKEAHLKLPHFQLHGFYRPADDCGGDWWWYRVLDETRVSVFVGDVTGHGVHAAMIATCVASCFKVLEKMSSDLPVFDLVRSAHEVLNDIAGSEYCMPSLAFEVDALSGQMKCWSAGAPVFCVAKKGQPATFMPIRGNALGLESEFQMGELSLRLEPGDRVWVSTDGILEMNTAPGTVLGERRFLKMINTSSELSAGQALTHIIQEADRMRDSLPQSDDFTLVMMEIT